MAFAALGKLYAECAVGKAGAVNSYIEARAEAIRWNEAQD